MYMEHDARLPHEVAEGELLCHLLEREALGGSCAGPVSKGGRRGCTGDLRPQSDRRDGMARAEGMQNGGVNGCGCDGGDSMSEGQIGNPYPCGENGVEGRSLAMVYAPVQVWQNTYDPQMGLSRGTLFRELDMPFYGKQTSKGGNCRGC